MKYKTTTLLSFEKHILNGFGLYREKPHYDHLPFCNFFGVLNMLILWIVTIQAIIEILWVTNDVENIMKVLTLLHIELATLAKALFFLPRRFEMIKITEILKNPLFQPTNDQQKILLDKYVRAHFIVKLSLRCWSVFIILIIMIGPIFEGHGLQMYVDVWFPYKEKYYTQAYILQFVGYLVTGSVAALFDLMITGLLHIGTLQIKFFKQRIIECREIFDEHLYTEEEIENIVFQRLKVAVDHQTLIYEYMKTMKSIFEPSIFAHISLSISGICVNLFWLISVPASVTSEYFTVLMICVLLLGELLLYSAYPQLFINEADDINEACYITRWEDCNPKLRRIILFIMERGLRPNNFKMGGILDVDMVTYLQVIKLIYSTFAVIKQTYG